MGSQVILTRWQPHDEIYSITGIGNNRIDKVRPFAGFIACDRNLLAGDANSADPD